MDWGKAKSILIVIFLVLNIFLTYNLIIEKWSPAVSDVQIEAAKSILKERGIKLNTEIPRNAESARRLGFEGVALFDMGKVSSKLIGKDTNSYSDEKMLINGDRQVSIDNNYTFIYTNKSPHENIGITDDKELEKNLRKLFKDIGLPTGELELDYIERQQGEVELVFVQKKGKYKVFNNKIEVKVSNEGIKFIECSLQKPTSSKKDESIMPAYKVLFQNLWQNSGMVISSIDLGYTIDGTEGEMTGFYEKLHWRIRTGDGQIKFYDAVTGEPQ